MMVKNGRCKNRYDQSRTTLLAKSYWTLRTFMGFNPLIISHSYLPKIEDESTPNTHVAPKYTFLNTGPSSS